MGFMLIILAIGIVLGLAGAILRPYIMDNFLDSMCTCAIIAGAALVGIAALFYLFTLGDVITKDLTFQRYMNKRATYVRLLNEDYNATNLANALEFNQDQKYYAYKEHTFMWSHFNTEGVYVDTIAIPTRKFIPKQIVNLNVDSNSNK